jgi:hypothetical protein
MRSAFPVLLLCLVAAAGCRDRGPAAPSPATPPTPPLGTMNGLRVFTEPASGFATSDVRDAQDQVVQFSVMGELIWAADSSRFPGYTVSGIYINAETLCACWFEVRFGAVNGERRAYLTADYGHDNPGTLLDIEAVNGALVVGRSAVFPPGTYTLSGFVTEATATGLVPVEGVNVYRPYGSGYDRGITDKSGAYSIHGLYDTTQWVTAQKDGYQTERTILSIAGDTRLDFALVRQ